MYIYVCVCVCFKDLLIFITKSAIQRGETERKVFHLMIQYSSDLNGWSYADPKPGARSSSLSPTWVQGPKALGRPRLLSQAQAGSCMGSGAARIRISAYIDTGSDPSSPASYPAPCLCLGKQLRMPGALGSCTCMGDPEEAPGS